MEKPDLSPLGMLAERTKIYAELEFAVRYISIAVSQINTKFGECVGYSSPVFIAIVFRVHAGKLRQVTNFTTVGDWAALLSTASISTWFSFIILFARGRDTAMTGGSC